MKPTGDRVCPPDITRAHELDALINEHAGTRDLNDSDHDTYNDELNCNKQTVKVKNRYTYATSPSAAASELLSCISGTFDPAVQQARDKDHATRSLANTQLLAQGQQLHGANGVTEKLQTQLFDLQTRLYEAKHERDLIQLRLEMMQMQQPPPNKATPKTCHQCQAPSYHWWRGRGGLLVQ
ncbi:hypothetical protein BDR03DRAFT_1015728 [Suillus americanus]|nr:hypothetical protein BDR03DRAFT_1015728 [Suillus americanus]